MPADPPDTRVADAINRVLDAEHATAAAIAEAQAAAQASIEAAREQRRILLETARQRVVRLHERAQARLSDRLQALDARAGAAPSDSVVLETLTDAAIRCVAQRLTADETA
jgi:vacuolar-type H+-ATPase subunit H